MMINKQDDMHPDDRRNLVIFIVAAISVWLFFDHFLLQPRLDAMRAAQEQQATQEITATAQQSQAEKMLPRETALARSQGQRIAIDNGALTGTINLKGARLDDLALQRYFKTLDKKEPVVLLSPANAESARYVELGWLGADSSVRVPGKDTLWHIDGATQRLTKETPLTLIWDNGQGLRFERHIAIDDNYMFTITERVTNKSGKNISLFPYNRLVQQGLPADYEGQMVVHEGALAYLDGELVERPYKKMPKEKPEEEISATTGWIGISDKYWFTSLIPPQDGAKKFGFRYQPAADEDEIGRIQTDIVGGALTLPPGQTVETLSYVFSGAKEVNLLNTYETKFGINHFDLAVDFGLYYFLTKPFFHILDFFGRLTGNFGIAIICLTIIVRLAVFPLANTSYRSFAKMKKIAPEMKELREKFGEDRVKLQEALVKLYEKEKVNPMAGCLPMVIQIPIFFALFKILSVTIEMRHAPFFGWIKDLSAHDPTSIFNLFGLIPWQPPQTLMIGAWSCAMLVAMLIQRQMNPPPQDKTQAMMNNIMPFFITWLLSKYAVGLVIYWTFSNTLSVIQQYVIMRSLGVEVHLFSRDKGESEMENLVKEGPSVHPGLGVIEDEIEEALFGEEEKTVVSAPKRKKKKK